MARTKKQDPRNHTVAVRLNKEEFAELQKWADRDGLGLEGVMGTAAAGAAIALAKGRLHEVKTPDKNARPQIGRVGIP